MVRRLKGDLRALGEPFPARRVEPVIFSDLPESAPELALARLLQEYGELRMKRIARLRPKERTEAVLVFSGLQQRLLSSIAAFAKTLEVHKRTLQKRQNEQVQAVAELAHAFARPLDASEEEAVSEELETQLLDIDEADAAEAATVLGAADATLEELNAELAKVDEMLAIAQAQRYRPDERVKAIAAWIRQNMIEDGNWNSRRLILFTEYEDTRRWLHDRLLEQLHDFDPHVACTRARDHLMVSGVEPGSEFLSGLLWGDLATCKELG